MGSANCLSRHPSRRSQQSRQAAGLGDTPRRRQKDTTPTGKAGVPGATFWGQEDRALSSRASHELGIGCGRAIGRATLGFMIAARRIKKYVDELVREFSPERVVMFGSHASGKPQADSDVDLLVVMKHRGAAAEQAARIRRRIRAGFPLDIIVRSPAVLQRRVAMGDGFIREILETGKVLHETDDA